MPTVQETAYPRLKSSVSARDLVTIYTPLPHEITLAEQVTRGEVAYLGFLVLLKTFQRLGYFVLLSQVPTAIVEHIASFTKTSTALSELPKFDVSGTRFRHIPVIRKFLHVQAYGTEARHTMVLAMSEAARTKEDLADLINVAIEELVRKKYELPAFDTLVRAARHIRTVVYHQFYRHVEATGSRLRRCCASWAPTARRTVCTRHFGNWVACCGRSFYSNTWAVRS